MKKQYLIILLIILLITTGTIVAFILDTNDKSDELIIGDVNVDLEAYFEKYNDQNELIKYTENLDYVANVVNEGSFTKQGVIKINISNRDDIQFIENFRVNIKIYSNVDTYFRIAPYEQLTLTYEVGGKTREVATTQKNYIGFNYDPNGKFFDNRIYDGFFYCKEKVKKINDDTPLILSFIGNYFEDKSFGVYEDRYSLQIGFIIEAVQALDGPQNNWGLSNTPWNTDW